MCGTEAPMANAVWAFLQDIDNVSGLGSVGGSTQKKENAPKLDNIVRKWGSLTENRRNRERNDNNAVEHNTVEW